MKGEYLDTVERRLARAQERLTPRDRVARMFRLSHAKKGYKSLTAGPEGSYVYADDLLTLLNTDIPALIEELKEQRRVRVHVVETLNAPTTCKVWRDGMLIFDGVSNDALLREVR